MFEKIFSKKNQSAQNGASQPKTVPTKPASGVVQPAQPVQPTPKMAIPTPTQPALKTDAKNGLPSSGGFSVGKTTGFNHSDPDEKELDPEMREHLLNSYVSPKNNTPMDFPSSASDHKASNLGTIKSTEFSDSQDNTHLTHLNQQQVEEDPETHGIIIEAAMHFSNGEEKMAADMLVDFLKSHQKADRKVWYVLLDIYHALGKKEEFEALGLGFAKRFDTSSPSWHEDENASSLHMPAINVASGQNVLILEGSVHGDLMDKAKDFIAASRSAKSCTIDISRMKMDTSTKEGFNALHHIMERIRKYRVSATLMGEAHVLSWLERKVEATKENKDSNDSAYWYLLLEILQWRGNPAMDNFENVSFEYTVAFELSGPQWDDDGGMTIEATEEIQEEPSNGVIEPDTVITEASLQRLQELINFSIAERGEARINFMNVTRMDFMTVGGFSSYLDSLDNSKKIHILEPSELILALLDMLDISSKIRIHPRKR